MNGIGSVQRVRSEKNSLAEPRSWEEINQRLAYVGEMERQIRALQDEFQRRVAVLKQQCLEASQPLERERERQQQQMERFYWAHRNELLAEGRKSVELAFGRLGSRRSRSLVVEDAEAAQQWLVARGLERFLRTRTEIDREAIRSALLAANGPGNEDSSILLACPAIRLRENEQFWYEVSLPAGSLGNPTGRSAETSNKSREAMRQGNARSRGAASWGGRHEKTIQQPL